MNCLLDAIKQTPQDRVAFISDKMKLTFLDIVNIYKKNKKVLQSLRNSTVAIRGLERDEFALLVALLDGNVKKMLFLPKDIDSSLVSKYYNETGVNYEVVLKNNNIELLHIAKLNYDNKVLTTEWIVPTSGTTNIPKLVAHTLESLTRTVKTNIEIGREFVWGLVFDIYRFSGIQVLLQSILGGSTLIISNSDKSIGESLNFFAKNNCNIISATPSFWRKAIMMPQLDNIKLKSLTLGGEIADKNILKALRNKFPNASIRHIYASTEAGVGFSVTDGKSGFPLDYLLNGVDNIKLKIDSNNLLYIKPNKKYQKYIGKNDMFDRDGFINTGDLVEIKNDRVYFLGRESGAINVGGNKVHPEEIEIILLNLPFIQAVHIYAKKNPIIGSLVCADIVLKDKNINVVSTKKDIINYCKANLEAFKVPAFIKFIDELEITTNGKIKRT